MKEKDEGSKLIKVYWEGIKFAIKLVDAEAIIIKIKAKETYNKPENSNYITGTFERKRWGIKIN